MRLGLTVEPTENSLINVGLKTIEAAMKIYYNIYILYNLPGKCLFIIADFIKLKIPDELYSKILCINVLSMQYVIKSNKGNGYVNT